LKKTFLSCLIIISAIAVMWDVGLAESKTKMIEVEVASLAIDSLSGQPVVILKDKEGKKAIRIWIGVNEANAISLGMNEVELPRPMTHDLIKSILEGLKAQVKNILIHDVRENTFFARIALNVDGKEVSIDSRPSDAIALAVRVNAPIFLTDKVYKDFSIDPDEEEGGETKEELSV
jgi:bifunctional DNase/RNase